MGWKLDKPLDCMSDQAEQDEIIKMWESEKHGGLWEGNNRLPFPMTFLCALIILTAFMITMPIWGQRPNAYDFAEHVKLMDSPEVAQLATPEEKMAYIDRVALERADSRVQASLSRHPITWDDLQNIAPDIKEAEAAGKYPLAYYSILGDTIVLANFEGAEREDGTKIRMQPWWDKGFTIDVFYVSYFVILMVFVCKRLPSFNRKPNMANAK